MKIAILQCLNVSARCAGVGCFKAYNGGSAHFARYGDEKPGLCTFFLCNGCEADHTADAGWLRKLNRLREEGVDRIHTANCVGEKCPHRATLLALIADNGFDIHEGTH